MASLCVPADAHKPLQAENNNDFENALEIPDHRISWVIYKQLQAGNINYYKFNANAGERFYAEIDIPKIDRLVNFTPSIILAGKGLNKIMVSGQNIAIREIDTTPSLLKQGLNVLAIEYIGTIPSREFYEEFSQTTFWQRQKLVIDNMPTSSSYYLMVASQEQSGKYALAIGEIEDFGLTDFVTVLPIAWFQTKFFFEDYVTPFIAIALVVGVTAITVIMLSKRRRLQIRSDSKLS
ncbi:MAG: hypothetical protein M3261_02310 [Thermoproteota archaeon]|nr:hypothetical protein [Thermoproteota archaeon]